MTSKHPLPDTTRTIHPRALKAIGHEACIAMLGVARDLRSGVIPPAVYCQRVYRGTACCIAGHTARRLNESVWHFLAGIMDDAVYMRLFCGAEPSDPHLAADAIERYIYAGADEPWRMP
jgi:hypothetical protein